MKLPEPTHRSYQLVNGEHQPFYTEAQMREMYQRGVTDAANKAQIAMLGIPYHWTKRVVAAINALKEQANASDK
jgi:predicted dinucleotide-binding enzyme